MKSATRIAGGSAIVTGELAIENKLPSQTGIAGIKIIHDVVEGLEAAVNHMPAMGPRSGIFKLPCGVMERLDQVGVADRAHIGSAQRSFAAGNPCNACNAEQMRPGSVLWGWRTLPSPENTGSLGEHR